MSRNTRRSLIVVSSSRCEAGRCRSSDETHRQGQVDIAIWALVAICLVLKEKRDISFLQIAASPQPSSHIFGVVLRPFLSGVKGDGTARVDILARVQVLDHRFQVGVLVLRLAPDTRPILKSSATNIRSDHPRSERSTASNSTYASPITPPQQNPDASAAWVIRSWSRTPLGDAGGYLISIVPRHLAACCVSYGPSLSPT